MIDGTAASSSTAVPTGRRSQDGCEFRQIERDAERDRHREEQCQDRGDDRAVDRHGRAEHLLDRIPVGGDQEARAELPERRETAQEQHHDDGAEQDEDEGAGKAGEEFEDGVADLEPASRGGMAVEAMACCKRLILVRSVAPHAGPVARHAYARLAYMRGLPSGPFTSARQALRTAAFTGSGSGMYSRPLAMLSPFL